MFDHDEETRLRGYMTGKSPPPPGFATRTPHPPIKSEGGISRRLPVPGESYAFATRVLPSGGRRGTSPVWVGALAGVRDWLPSGEYFVIGVAQKHSAGGAPTVKRGALTVKRGAFRRQPKRVKADTSPENLLETGRL